MDNTRLLNIAAIMVIGVLTVYVMVEARVILVPLAWALLISLLILPVVKWFEKKKVPRFLAILLVLSLVTIVIFIVLYLLSVQVAGLLGDRPVVTKRLNQWMIDLQHIAETRWGLSHEFLSRQLTESLSEIINTALHELRNSLFSVFQTLTLISIIPLYVFFMLYYGDLYYEGLMRIAKRYQKEASFLVNKVNRVLQQYLSGVILVTLIMAVMFYLVLLLFGLNYALFFALFLAIFNLIPYIGVIIASLSVVIYALVTFESVFYPAGILISLWMIQMIENNFITPYIVGTRVKLNPMVALIAIFIGSAVWGISGMILVLPFVGTIKVIFDEIDRLKPYGLLLGDTTNQKAEQ